MGIDFSFYHEYKKNDKWRKHPFQLSDCYRGSALDSAMRQNNIYSDWCDFDPGLCSRWVASEINLYTEWFYVLSRDNVYSIIQELRKEGTPNWDSMVLVLEELFSHMGENSRVVVHGI